ncbi:hypothetical protein ACJ72_06682 [Emergomyces africanus]|uniref:NADP-dependent oxidoreductase domain-containing protein n=1 Tax=Emergomyces africanus TaxID=1955775 RepID=A0A1B7NQA2_9EURO|nr:hypothetical protein ACJ72_06682 [Emergomyces africanus]
MEKVIQTGKARPFGVSNFRQHELEVVLKTAGIPPAINQIEFHPYLQHSDLAPFQERKEYQNRRIWPSDTGDES